MNHLKHQNYKNEHIEMKCLKHTQKSRILKVKNNHLELQKRFPRIKR